MFDMSENTENTEKSIDLEAVLFKHLPVLQCYPVPLRRLLIWGLKALVNEDRINQFLRANDNLKEFDFIDQVFDELKIDHLVKHDEIRNIPATGRVLIVANHPLGGLDGLALLRLIASLRRDVLIVVNELLMNINSLKAVFIPIDVFGQSTKKPGVSQIIDALNDEKAVIIFPSGEVSRAGPKGIRDRKWLSGFLRIAEKTSTPILPIHIRARNSMIFYLVSRLSPTLSMLMLPREMTGFHGKINFTIGQPIAINDIEKLPLGHREKAQMISDHLHRIGHGKSPIFSYRKSIIHPVNGQAIRKELKTAEKLGKTADNRHILLLDDGGNTAVMDEIGRLREMTFRSIGEGTGQSKDIDVFDAYYRHLLLWDDDKLEIAGAYRLGEIWRWEHQDFEALYSSTLFNFQPTMEPYVAKGLELGRSFVQPQYWGMRSLEYLWQGIGAYLARHQQVQYLFGPVSLSSSFPKSARDMLAHFYTTHFPDQDRLATATNPYVIDSAAQALLHKKIPGHEFASERDWLREQLGTMGLKFPTLFKHYTDVCMAGGVRFCGFNVDPAFNDCVDGLVMIDLCYLKPKKRSRYIGITCD